jgi:coenzyme F420-reducing hydrogenase gamma subunit
MFTTLMVCAAAALPVSAYAQQGDNAYCSALAQKYERYVGDSTSSRRSQQRDVNVDAAISGCPTRAAASIPVIEKALQNARVDLPPRT